MKVFTITLGSIVEHTTIVAEKREDAMEFFFSEFNDMIFDESNMTHQSFDHLERSVLLVEAAEKDWEYLSDIKVFIEDDDILMKLYGFTEEEIEDGVMPTGLQVYEQGLSINKKTGKEGLPVLISSEFYS